MFPLIDQPFMTADNSGHWLYRWLDRVDQKTLLELGCGEGLDTEIVLERVGFWCAQICARIVSKRCDRGMKRRFVWITQRLYPDRIELLTWFLPG